MLVWDPPDVRLHSCVPKYVYVLVWDPPDMRLPSRVPKYVYVCIGMGSSGRVLAFTCT